ncbi:MAG: nitroreductase [Deltaproteobacteria bacterium]|nr:nitroreductase [Deltaproteobacteria bacterium]
MDVLTAIEQRRSTRAYLETPIDKETLKKLLYYATQAPSAINIQPWELTVVSGEERKRLSRLLVKRMKERNISCGPGARKPLAHVFVQRQKELLRCILPTLPENTIFNDFINEGSCNFYGAPTAIFLTLDNTFSNARFTDIGIVLGYLVLAAHAMGLGACPIGLVTAFEDDIRDYLNIPDEKTVVIAVAVGYRDEASPVNRSRSSRAPLEELVRWRE